MSFWSALILLLLQAQPLWGLALCMGLGAGDEHRMEAGCAMNDDASSNASDVEPSHDAFTDAAPERFPDHAHGCMLADVCSLVTPTVAPSPALLVVADAPQDPAFWPSENVQGQEHRAPPTPPPNS